MINREVTTKDWMEDIIITTHFIERFIERIDHSLKEKIWNAKQMKDYLNSVLNDREKKAIQFFKSATNVKLPFNTHQIVLENKTFITIY